MDSILIEAEKIVNGERAESYGNPLIMGERIGKIWSAILGCEVTPEQVQLCMIGLKVARECNKPQRDNLVDIAGYAQVLNKVRELQKPVKIKDIPEYILRQKDIN